MKKIFLLAAFTFWLGVSALSAQCILWDTEHIEALKADPDHPLYLNIVGAADYYLNQQPADVVHKKSTFSGDLHNYESLCIYTWPDENNPDAPWVNRNGYVNPAFKDYDFERLITLKVAVQHLGIAYYLTGEEKYHEGIEQWLSAWFVNPATSMHPHMQYAQVHPGMNENHGTPWGMIEAYSFVEAFEGYLLAKSVKPFDKDLDKKLHEWVKKFATWMQTSEFGRIESSMENQHSVIYDVMLYYFASFNNDKKTMKRITSNFASNRLEKQIDDEGKMPFELDGGRVFHDHLYNLQHIVDFCMMQRHQGKNFYGQNKEIIDRVFDFMLPYLQSPENFPYNQVSDWDSDIADLKIELMRMSRLNTRYGYSRIGYEVDPFETHVTVVK
ncbi:MAG: alginate lyase family protein [Bacteroidales bacterium]|nr:alginate lyase family protein [Bacteroidales bacterium]